MKQPIDCNEWDCPHNEDGKCYTDQDDCPELQEFFANRRKTDFKKGVEE